MMCYTVQHRKQLLHKIMDFFVLLKTCVETLVMMQVKIYIKIQLEAYWSY